MRAGQCVDWLLLQSLGHKNSAAVTCGQMAGKDKTLLAKGNWLLLHFHSATTTQRATGVTEVKVKQNGVNPDKVVRNMSGFRVKIKSTATQLLAY